MKHTKIVATISDRNCDPSFIKTLHEAGMNVVRLNTAHQSEEDSLKVINSVRKVSDKIPLLLDTKGPEIRTTPSDNGIEVKRGDKVFICDGPANKTEGNTIYTSYEYFTRDVPLNSQILIDDGDIELIVKEKKKGKLICVVGNDGKIKGRKSINIPGVHISLPSLSDKDRKFIDFAIRQDIDFIAHSFVRNKKDVLDIQNILDKKKSNIKIIAKIENQEGVDNIDEILDHVFGVMVARGDLGIEISAEKIPGIQKMLIRKCIEKRKIVITATQMLHTMIDNPRPTRAEVSDIANAIYDGTDAIMLSGETAYGKYPVEAVKIMTKIANEVESNKLTLPFEINKTEDNITEFLTKSATYASNELPVKAIVMDTMTGKTARYLSAFRGKKPILAYCYNKRVARELAISHGIIPEFVQPRNTTDEFIRDALESISKKKLFNNEDLILILAGSFGKNHGASFIEISSMKSLKALFGSQRIKIKR